MEGPTTSPSLWTPSPRASDARARSAATPQVRRDARFCHIDAHASIFTLNVSVAASYELNCVSPPVAPLVVVGSYLFRTSSQREERHASKGASSATTGSVTWNDKFVVKPVLSKQALLKLVLMDEAPTR